MEAKKRCVRVILKGQAKAEFEQLDRIACEQLARGETNSEEMQLLKSIRQKIEIMKTNPVYGEKITQCLIPKSLDASNLFCVKLTGYWRMLYSLEGNRVEVIAFVLYLIDHPTYDGLFGYRKK